MDKLTPKIPGKKFKPRLTIEPNAEDKTYTFLALLCLVALLTIPFIYFNQLPDDIPIHYNIKGEVDNYGSKNSLWVMPALGVILFVVLTLLLKIPHQFNYPVSLHEENAKKQYSIALTLMRSIRFITTALLLSITSKSILTAFGKNVFWANTALWIFIAAIIIIPIYYYLQALKQA